MAVDRDVHVPAGYRETFSAIDAEAINVGGGDQSFTRRIPRGIYVGGAGNLVCRLLGSDADITFTGLAAGQVYPFAVSTIRAAGSGTTITNSAVLY